MSRYISYEEVLRRCQRINQQYQINQDRFDQIVDYLVDTPRLSNEEKIHQAFQLLLQAVNEEIAGMEATADLQPTCQMGCAFCCYFPIVITKMEADLMKQAINQMPADRKTFIKRHIADYYHRYQDQVDSLGNVDIAGDPEAKLSYKKANLPCVLLNTETNTCLAYEFRPLPCRTYVNYTDPKACEENHMPKETISYDFLYQEYMGAFNELLQVLYDSDEQIGVNYPDDVYQEDLLINWLKEA
ncbi:MULTISPECIES: YkgJ family cysteine cluster protein [Gracilibacillus]|uniref:YkgJ family cysteine cluster protein n=1 Tax=Gracilibacillus TaxID=74385 RepID=UPI000824D7F7|nr:MULTISPECIES: YkgJ family cysteine cluster protein [Gracilibacillus]